MTDRRTPTYIRTQQTLEGTTHRFPPRELGKARGAGVAFIAFGLIVTVFMFFWMRGPIVRGWNNGEGIEWGSMIFGLFGTPGLLIGLALIVSGLGVVNNWFRCEVLVSRDSLISVERIGLLRWKRKRPIADIERLVITDATSAADHEDEDTPIPPSLQNLAAIRIEGDRIEPMLLAPGFTRGLLEPFAQQLAEAVGAHVPTRLIDRTAPTQIEVVNEKAPPGPDVDKEDPAVYAQPEDGRVVFQQHANGISIAVPPAGLIKGSKGLFPFAIVWNGCVGLFAYFLVHARLTEGGERFQDMWIPAVFIGAFLAIGIGLLMGAIGLGRRQAALVTRGNELMVKRTGPFKSSDHAWRSEELAAIRMGPSGVSINDVPVMELQIHPQEGAKVGLLSQLDNRELEWIAAHLRKALAIGKQSPT